MISRDVLDQVKRLLRPLSARLANLVGRAVVQVVDDDQGIQSLQIGVLDGEDIDDAERFQEYGFSSRPLIGAEAVAIFPGGDRGHPLVVAVDDRRHRPTGLEPGEVTVYSSSGASVTLLADGSIELVPGAGGAIRIGDAAAADPVARASDIEAIKTAISGAAVLANDGGATLKTNIIAAWPVSVGSAKVHTD